MPIHEFGAYDDDLLADSRLLIEGGKGERDAQSLFLLLFNELGQILEL